MTLSDFVIEYRKAHGLSQRAFGAICGVSNGYISMLEKGINPNNGDKLIPKLPQLEKIAAGMGISLDELFSAVDDMVIRIPALHKETSPALSPCHKEFYPMTTGERMKDRRKQIGLSAEAVADKLHVSPATIYRYENGDIEKIPGDILRPLSIILNVSEAWLMGWSDINAMPATVSGSELSEAKSKMIELIRDLPEDKVDMLYRIALAALER